MLEQTWSADAEYYQYDSLQDLIDDNEDISSGDVVSVGDKEPASVNTLVDAEDVLELLGERAYDNFGECAEDFPEVSDAAAAELDKLLQQWIDKHCNANFYWIKNVKPYTVTEEDIKEK